MFKEIKSLQNYNIKYVLQIKEKSRTRKKDGVFFIEGKKELNLAIKNGYKIKTIYFNAELCGSLINSYANSKVEIISVSKKIYKKIAYRGSTEGLVAIAETKSHLLNDVKIKNKNPFILVAESIEKPGNIGALIRTADAANVDVLIIADPRTELYNPNVIRSSVGGIFTVQIAIAKSIEVIDFMNKRNIPIYSAILKKSISYDEVNYTQSCCIAVGTENNGLSDQWKNSACKAIKIPMLGSLDSMNVSVAAGIILFEVCRQRKINPTTS